MSPKNFAITGVSDYIAPRHLKAIKDTESNLIAALGPHDSVGLLAKHFPNTRFFTEYERFDRKSTGKDSGVNNVRIIY